MLKRLAVWLLEISAESVLIPTFLVSWFGMSNHGLVKDLLVGFAGTVGLFMQGTYYPLTTAALRLVWRNPARLWLYSLVSAALIIAHLQVFYIQIHTGWDISMRLPVQAGAGLIAFACTFAGGRVLRKWINAAKHHTGEGLPATDRLKPA